MKNTYPSAIVQCQIDHLSQHLLNDPNWAKQALTMYTDWGINRFSIKWGAPQLRKLLGRLDRFGFVVNIYNVPNLESFLKALLLMPRSITSDFDFPKWHYFGRGSGENLQHYEYSLATQSA